MYRPRTAHRPGWRLSLGLTLSLLGSTAIAATEFSITSASWKADTQRLLVTGAGDSTARGLTLRNGVTGAFVALRLVRNDQWQFWRWNPPAVPCRVLAVQWDGQFDLLDVADAPTDCDGTIPSDGVSINSTSQTGLPGDPVAEQPSAGNNLYRVFATNDLGMHCGDLDTRVSSVLPPFNVMHAQVIKRGADPEIQTPTDGIEVVYSAASNPADPILSGINGGGTAVLSSKLPDGTVYKTNFWDVAPGATEPTALAAYRAFYPPGILDAFYPIPADMPDLGLPAPNTERLYLGDGQLTAEQQTMPGRQVPYLDNTPKPFRLFTVDQPFFIDFPFGYIIDEVNWFEAAGLPITAFDDAGRENPWPLYRVQAKDSGGATLASVDSVAPISGEANCGACHNAVVDGGNGAGTRNLNVVATTLDDPQLDAVPLAISKEYAADLNLVRLHDQKHGTTLEADKPVVCQQCHYTPALDLAHVGPKGPADGDANGREQTNVKSMSNVVHSHHAGVTDAQGTLLFPTMPPAVNAQGELRDPVAAREILNDTCYQCHPGRRTDCLRGAMASGGMLCQDCHGQMAQVGDDFSRQVTPGNPGAFELAADFFTNPDTPRVPWAHEPGCGSCHTGDANSNLHAAANTLGSPSDNIRLMQAFRIGDPKATPIVPVNKRFAENTITGNPEGNGNPMLYRVSKGHEGVFCEACHGATHGIWPNKDPLANDNIAAEQLQGHSGVIIECDTCHTGDLGDTLQGPHGMHAVGSAGARFADGGHEDVAEDFPNSCRACHGQNGQGTVLSTMHQDRMLKTDEDGPKLFPKGHQVTCFDCHENKL